jgi:dynein heavy chain
MRADEEDKLSDFEREGTRRPEVIDGQTAKTGGEHQKLQKAAKNREWVDLDKYIELLLDSKSEDEIVFIYCNPNKNGDPYDLQVCAYDKRNVEKYYTLSGKGLSVHEGDHLTEFISLAQWLINRDSYNHIKELKFFKKLRKWKFMRIWKDTIKQEARKKASTKLKEKLFFLHDTFRKHLLTHRDYCINMEKLRFVDTSSNIETQTTEKYKKVQEKTRKEANKRIGSYSSKCRDNINGCINKVLQDLKQRIDAETKLDEERRRINPIQSTTTLALKEKPSQGVFEELGFPPGMTYGHCSSLREECSRFIRFAYLVDFMALESLSGIYLGSVNEITNKLRFLEGYCSLEKVMRMDLDEASNPPAAPVRGTDPLFTVVLELNHEQEIPASKIVKTEVEDFKPPPHGTSQVKDFDLLAHLELEPEPDPDKKPGDESEEEADAVFVKKYRDTCPEIHTAWLSLVPPKQEFVKLFENTFTDGLQAILAFERFSKHPSMKLYADALEEWDDRIGDNWEAPDSLFLNPIDWIKENKLHSDCYLNINSIFDSAFDKAAAFTSRFREVLEMFWMNERADLSICVHERLRNPTDSLQHAINLFLYQDEVFSKSIPASTNLGLIKLESKRARQVLLPSPKK